MADQYGNNVDGELWVPAPTPCRCCGRVHRQEESSEPNLPPEAKCICRIRGVADLTCPKHGVNGTAPFSDGQE